MNYYRPSRNLSMPKYAAKAYDAKCIGDTSKPAVGNSSRRSRRAEAKRTGTKFQPRAGYIRDVRQAQSRHHLADGKRP